MTARGWLFTDRLFVFCNTHTSRLLTELIECVYRKITSDPYTEHLQIVNPADEINNRKGLVCQIRLL